jgi:hypothetical protein
MTRRSSYTPGLTVIVVPGGDISRASRRLPKSTGTHGTLWYNQKKKLKSFDRSLPAGEDKSDTVLPVYRQSSSQSTPDFDA